MYAPGKLFVTVLLVLSFKLSEDAFGATTYKRCDSVNSNNQQVDGQCVPFPLCPRLLEIAKNQSKTLDDFRILRKLTCGFHQDKPRICCPETDVYVPPGRDTDEFSNLPIYFPNESEIPGIPPSLYDFSNFSRRDGSSGIPYSKGTFDKLVPPLEECGEPRIGVTGDRIIGGNKALQGQFPFMALLYRIDTETDEEEYYCSGTIINQFYILTAAHCILTNVNSSHKLYEIIAYIQIGVTDVTQRCHQNNQSECLQERRYEAKDTLVHPKYVYGSRDRSHDIALIRTAKPMELSSEYRRPVCLPFKQIYEISLPSLIGPPTQDDDDTGNGHHIEAGYVVGWGRESNIGTQKSPSALKYTTLPVLSRGECQHRYAGQVKISDKQICGGGLPGRDTCVGDSGGPLLIDFQPENEGDRQYRGKMFQTGIISFGPAICGRTGKPSVYTNVFAYVDWILENMYL